MICHVDLIEYAEMAQKRIASLETENQRLQPAQVSEPRAIIRHFAAAMERKLAANDGVKGGWRDDGKFQLLRCLRAECDELSDALYEALRTGWANTAAIRDEACDVALYALMIADVCGALPPTDERGRAVKGP